MKKHICSGWEKKFVWGSKEGGAFVGVQYRQGNHPVKRGQLPRIKWYRGGGVFWFLGGAGAPLGKASMGKALSLAIAMKVSAAAARRTGGKGHGRWTCNAWTQVGPNPKLMRTKS